MKRKIFLITLILCIVFSGANIFATGKGTTPLGFLLMGSGARAYSVAEAFTAVDVDPEAINYNPAGGFNLPLLGVNFLHIEWFDIFKYEYLGMVYPIKNKQTKKVNAHFNANIKYFHYSDFDWNIEGEDGRPVKFGSLSGGDFALTLGYNRKINNDFGWGINAKYIKSTLHDASCTTGGVDLGLIYIIRSLPLNLGLSLRNFGMKVKYTSSSTPENMPADINFGMLYKPIKKRKASFKLNLFLNTYYRIYEGVYNVQLGGEAIINKRFILGAGYKVFSDTAKLSIGAGFKQGKFRINYTFIPEEAINNVHLFSLTSVFELKEPEISFQLYPPPGVYAQPIVLTIDVKNMKKGKVFFTTDGTVPKKGAKSFWYKGKPIKIKLKNSKRFVFIAISIDKRRSKVFRANYIIKGINPVIHISPPPGNYSKPVVAKLSVDNMSEGLIYYTTDGSEPDELTSKSIPYRGIPLTLKIKGSKFYRFLAISSDGIKSKIFDANYRIGEVSLPEVIVEPARGVDEQPIIIITVKNMEKGKIYFTIDGSDPTEESRYLVYKGEPIKIRVKRRKQFKFLAVAEDGRRSPITRSIYTVNLNPPEITLTPGPGQYTGPVSVLVDVKNMDWGKIYFTVDGTEPNEYSRYIEYKGEPIKIKIKSSRVFKFLAISDNGKKSKVFVAEYVVK